MQLLVRPNYVILSRLAQDLQLVQQLLLAVHKAALAFKFLPESMDLVLTVGIFDFDSLLDSTLLAFLLFDDHFLRVNNVTKLLSSALKLFLLDLEHVEGLHE